MFKFIKHIFGGASRQSQLLERHGTPGTSRLPGGVDWHCHILPGVDDGFQDPEKSLEMLRLYEDAGMKEVWLTPHIMEDVPNETSHLRQVFADFQKQYQQDFAKRNPADKEGNEGNENKECSASGRTPRIPLKLHLAAENMLDALFERRLRANDLLPLGEDGKYLLVETSIFSAPMNFQGLLERIKNKGYTPVLAHPERYLYMEKGDYEKLKAQGIKFQRNLFSIKGQYGDKVRKRCKWLMKQDMYDLVGSDLHRKGIFWQYW